MKLTVATTAPVLEALASYLVEWGAGGIIEGPREVSAYFSPPAREEVESRLRRYAADLGVPIQWTWDADVGERWRDAWKAFFRPRRVSDRLAVCPSWEEWSPVQTGVRVIRMDPGQAFGTGTHETTQLCLQLIDEALAQSPTTSLLDVGCGSGILSIAARLLGVPKVVGLDVDPLAASVARENARLNGVDDGFAVLCGDLRAVRGTYPLVVANILYQVLLGLASELTRRVSPGGRLVLSGMLASELESAERVYGRLGFREVRRAVKGEWAAITCSS